MTIDWDEVHPELPARRRLVTRRRVLLAAVVMAGIFLVGALTWILTDDPLELGGLTGAPEGTMSWTSVDTGFGDVVYYVSARELGTFEVGYDVANTGPLPVSVQGVASPSRFTFAGMARYPTFEEPDRRVAGQIVPFEPVTIEPGDTRYLILQLRVTNQTACSSPGSFRTPSSPTIEYRTLGVVPRTATLDLPFTVVEVCGDELPPSYSWQDGTR